MGSRVEGDRTSEIVALAEGRSRGVMDTSEPRYPQKLKTGYDQSQEVVETSTSN